MGFAWTRNYYAVADVSFPTIFCFESKKSRDSATLCFGLLPMSAKEAYKTKHCRDFLISDFKYKMLHARYLFDETANSEVFMKEMCG